MLSDRVLRSLSRSRVWYLAYSLVLVILLMLFSGKPVIDSSLAGYNIDNNPYDSTAKKAVRTVWGRKYDTDCN
jgi:hypothetical protein